MTREEYIEFANALKNNYTIDFDKLPEFCDMAVSALTGGEYIKKSELLQHVTTEELSDFKDCDVIHAEKIDELTTYSFPDSKSVINKVLEVIKSQRFKAYDWYASLAPTLGKSCQKDYETDMEIYDGVIEAVELYRDSVSDNSDSAENKGDLISRQAVEKLVWDYLRNGTYENIAFYEHFLELPTYSFPDSAEGKRQITALEAENKTLRIKLENAEDVLRGLKEDLADTRAELRERW